MMSRIYIRIFLSFWVVTILALLGSSLIIHWFNLGADKHFTSQHEEFTEGPGARLSREIVSDAVNHTFDEVKQGIQELPQWVSQYFYMVDDTGVDILLRPIPKSLQRHIDKLSEANPLYQSKDHRYFYNGRYFQLSDGTNVRLITFPPHNKVFGWKLFFYNLWGFLIACIVFSGAACFLLSRFLTREFTTLNNATLRLAKGDWNVRVADQVTTHHSELHQLATSFDYMAANLQKSMLEQQRLIKDVSHELRSPLARLQVALAIAQQKASNNINDELEKIKHAADYLNDVISNILSLPTNDNEPWQLTDTIELNSLLVTLLDNFEAEAKTKNIHFRFHPTSDEALVESRGLTLVSVFDNIIRNAIHYTFSDTTIDIKLIQVDNKQYQITIKDQGPGVEEKHIKDIFEPFFRTCEARDRQSGGYGLGLAIAQRTVRLHGGNINAQNGHDFPPSATQPSAQKGLAIIVTLPVADALQ
jgi:two-component system sensor histidine kinase CpxA